MDHQEENYHSFYNHCFEGNMEQVKNMLISGEIDLSHYFFTNLYFNNILSCAVQNENVEMVKILLDCGRQVNAESLLHETCKKGNYEIAEILITSGIDINSTDKDFHQPIYYAVKQKHVKIVELLLGRGANAIEYQDLRYKVLLNFGTFDSKTMAIVKLLLDRKIIQSIMPLYSHAIFSGSALLLQFLIRKGIDVNVKTESDRKYFNGLPPLNVACQNGNLEIVKMLLNAGADIVADHWDCYGGFGKTDQRPLYVALSGRHASIVKLLIERGAKKGSDIDCKFLLKCFNRPFENADLEIVKVLFKHKMICLDFLVERALIDEDLLLIKYLVENGIGINAKSKSSFLFGGGLTPLHIACKEADYELTNMLINSGAKVNNQDFESHHPLFYAIDQGHRGIVKLLLEKGANFGEDKKLKFRNLGKEASDKEIIKLLLKHKVLNDQIKGTLISYAVIGNNVPVLNLLIDQKVDVQSVMDLDDYIYSSYQGLTLLCVACRKGNLEVIEILLKARANPNAESSTEYKQSFIPLTSTSDASVMKMLLKFGANINGQDASGNTALHQCKNQECIKFLISRGIDTSIKNQEGKTAVETFGAHKNGDELLAIYKECMEEVSKMKSNVSNRCGLSIYDFLLMSEPKLAQYVNNNDLQRTFNDPEFLKQFPIFGERIREKFKQG